MFALCLRGVFLAGSASAVFWFLAYVLGFAPLIFAEEISGFRGDTAGLLHLYSEQGFSRFLFSLAGYLFVGVAHSSLLLACMLLSRLPISVSRGLLWGVCAFLCLSLIPVLGVHFLSFSLEHAGLLVRQVVWLFLAAYSALTLGALVFRRWYLFLLLVFFLPLGFLVLEALPFQDLVSQFAVFDAENVVMEEALFSSFLFLIILTSGCSWLLIGGILGYVLDSGGYAPYKELPVDGKG